MPGGKFHRVLVLALLVSASAGAQMVAGRGKSIDVFQVDEPPIRTLETGARSKVHSGINNRKRQGSTATMRRTDSRFVLRMQKDFVAV